MNRRFSLAATVALLLAGACQGGTSDESGVAGRSGGGGRGGGAGSAAGGTAGLDGSAGSAGAGSDGSSSGSGGPAGGSSGNSGNGGFGGGAVTGRGGGAAGAAGSTGAAGSGGTTGTGGGSAGRGGAGGIAGAGLAGSGGTGGLSGLLVPAEGALLGAFVGTGTIAQLETTLSRKLAVSHNFYGWTDDWTTWVRSTAQAGYIPLITWEAWTNGSAGIPLDDIISGAHDAMIRSRAQSSLAVGQKFFLRWGHEMNGNWYPWDGFHNGASTAANAKYISAYRHIHDLFAAAGASNVLWVFSPNVDSVPGDAWNQWANYYPGDGYVDWMAFDGYNWGTVMTTSTWRTFSSMTSTIYAGLVAKGKPIMIPETASAEQGGDKAAWIAAMLPALKGSFPSIKALVWFHMNKETDWRIDSSAGARTSFVQMANDPYFNP
ncbi:MAG TPA: glycosyl hydrolase [Polyangia bacterium]|nr:glycosyl hydrolase [Polyangia bacterium]